MVTSKTASKLLNPQPIENFLHFHFHTKKVVLAQKTNFLSFISLIKRMIDQLLHLIITASSYD